MPVTFILGEVKPLGFFNNIKFIRGGHGFLWSRLREAEITKDVDVLILGSSIAYRGIDTRAFDSLGLKAFNLGSSNQTPLQTEYLLNKHLERMNPSIVIWDVTPFTLNNSGYESYIDLVSNDGANWKLFHMIGKHKKYEGIHTLVYVWMKESLTNYYSFKESKFKKNDKYISGGFVEKNYSTSNVEVLEDKKPLLLKEYQKESLENSLINLKIRGAKIFLITGPLNPIVYSNVANRDEINGYFKNIVKKYELLGFIDFNQIIGDKLDPIYHFTDPSHLNQIGVEIYNEKLIELLLLNTKLDSKNFENN